MSDPENTLPMWTIYFGATDMPAGVYRVRRCLIGPLTVTPDEECADYPSLELARAQLIELGLYNIHRNPGDLPHIVECWI